MQGYGLGFVWVNALHWPQKHSTQTDAAVTQRSVRPSPFDVACPAVAETSLVGLDPLIANLKRKVCSPRSFFCLQTSSCLMLALPSPQIADMACKQKADLRVQIKGVDKEILSAVQQQSSTGSRAR